MATFSEHLRARADDDLVDLLRRRPDLAAPSPATLSSLAARATSRASLDRALNSADAGVLQVVEATVALLEDAPQAREVSVDDLVRATGADIAPSPSATAGVVHAAVERALALALLYPAEGGLRPAPGVAELLGPYVAGLAPVEPSTGSRLAATAERDRDRASEVTELLPRTPPAARSVLDALTWGPPVGVLPAPGSPAAEAVDWLVARGLLVPRDARHVLLPRHVAAQLRDGRTHRTPAVGPPPPSPAVPRREAGTTAAESAAAAERVTRLVHALVGLWGQSPPAVLRSGGLGVRDLRRTAQALDVAEDEAAFVVELASAAGLVADDGDESPVFAPTPEADGWGTDDLPDRWSVLAATWLATTRTPWQVGARDAHGALRAALDPELTRPWAPRVRRAVLTAVAEMPDGTAPALADVVAVLTWRTPRAVPPETAVAAVLREAGWLGVLGAGALSPAGRSLLDGSGAAAAIARSLPPAVDELLLQADLTGIVPGRPSDRLEALLERATTVESRGGALTVRFTPESVRSALDSGETADDLLAALAGHSRSGVPQPLEYLVRDAARRHGRLRAGAAGSYVRTEDPALLAGLVEDPRLAALGLVRLAPTVIAAQASTAELLAALRARGLAPVAEGPDGRVVRPRKTERRAAGRRSRALPGDARAAGLAAAGSATDLAALVATLGRNEDQPAPDRSAPAAPAGRPARPARARGTSTPATGPVHPLAGTADPAVALGLLREAAAEHTEVWLELVGARGGLERRRVRPLRVDGGRVRVVDTTRDAEIVVAAHRIADVTPIRAAGTEDEGDA